MDLKDHMREAGEAVPAKVICEQNGCSKGCGIVEYATEEEAKKAIETLIHSELKGRTIFVREDQETSLSGGGPHAEGGKGSQSTSVYAWNLSYETTWQDLKDHMRKAGNVDQATILTEERFVNCKTTTYRDAPCTFERIK
jgi:RNA recognition motif-containing protein